MTVFTLDTRMIWKKDSARARELQIKNWSHAKKVALATQDWQNLNYFSKPPCERPSTTLGVIGDNNDTPILRDPK
jgi:hypothetical protein